MAGMGIHIIICVESNEYSRPVKLVPLCNVCRYTFDFTAFTKK